MIEENTGIMAEELIKRKAIFRVLYIFLFCKQSNFLTTFASLHKRQFVSFGSYTENSILKRRSTIASNEALFNQNFPIRDHFSTLIEERTQTPGKLKDIDNIFAHPSLPILCQIEESNINFIYTKTLTVINSLSFNKAKKIKHFEFDRSSFKFLVVDGSLTVNIYKFTINFDNITLIKSIENMKVYWAVFMQHDSTVLMSTTNHELYTFNLIWKKMKKVEHEFQLANKTKMTYVSSLKSILFVNKSKGTVYLVSALDFYKSNGINLNGEELTCYHVHEKMLLIGFTNGYLKVYSLVNGSLIFEQTFGEAENKKVKVEEVTVVLGFVIVGLSSGNVSIVMKI